MTKTTDLSEARRALLEKYLRGELPETAIAAHNVDERSLDSPESKPNIGSRVTLVQVQDGGSRIPFFYVHVHWDTGAFYCFPLANELGVDQPFYVLEPYDFAGLQILPLLEDMAATYIESMRSIQPEGPYILGGFCGGGLIALEMARQLQMSGQDVEMLVLIEPGVGPALITWGGSFIRYMGKLIRLNPEKQLDVFLILRHVYRFLFRSQYRHSQGFSIVPTIQALHKDWMGIFVWMVSGYSRPRKYPGKTIQIWAINDPVRRKAWPKVAVAKEVETYSIPGKHFDLITDQLHVLSTQLKTCLEKLQGAGAESAIGDIGSHGEDL
jgi:pimeloyl-ACP methyl ester carboxylesterase